MKKSTEEILIELYLEELKENNFIIDYIFQPKSFQLFEGLEKQSFTFKKLKTKQKKVYSTNKYLLNPREYTADFKILWNTNSFFKFIDHINKNEFNKKIPFLANCDEKHDIFYSYIEVKAQWDSQNMTRLFTSRTQPYIWDKFKKYIQLVKPFDLFEKTFIPKKAEKYMYYQKPTKNTKIGDKKFKFEYRSLNEYLETLKN